MSFNPASTKSDPPTADLPVAPTKPGYPLGHDDAVLNCMTWRTVTNSAGFLLPHLKSTAHVLDLGCGPGTVTAGLSLHCESGRVVGLDSSESVVAAAAAKYGDTATFVHGDAKKLPFSDDEFDVVFAHQVFKYFVDVPAVLAEIRRVLRPDGLLAVRSGLVEQCTGWPCDMKLLKSAFGKSIRAMGADPQIGISLPAKARDAGFKRVKVQASTWCYSEPEERREECQVWMQILNESEMVKRWAVSGIASQEDINTMHRELRKQEESECGVSIMPQVDILAWME